MDSRRNFIGRVAGGLAGTLAAPGEVLGAAGRVRFGLIGAGARGLQLLREAAAGGNVQCLAVADVYETRREQAKAAAPEAVCTADFREVVERPGIDAVLIATPQHLHAEPFVAALEAGLHVYVERTAALTLNDAKRMRSAAQGAPRAVVQVGHQICSSGLLTDAVRFVESGWLGRLTSIEGSHYRNTPHGKPPWRRPLYPDMTPERIDWDRFRGGSGSREFDAERYVNWRLYWDYSGGSIHECLSQQLAFWHRALGLAIPDEVTARGSLRLWEDGREVPDTMTVAMEYAPGLSFHWRSSFGNSHLGTGEYLLGTDGTVQRGQQVRYWPQKVNRPDGRETLGREPTRPRAHMRNFLEAIRSGGATNCPFETGYQVSVACAMAVEAYRRGRTVRWDAGREEIVPVSS